MKCLQCSFAPAGHPFKLCGSVKCQCLCVKDIYVLAANSNEDKSAPEHPLFLDVSYKEVKSLPNNDEKIRRFNKVDKTEWLSHKKADDKRRKKKSKLDYWGDKI
jgi:isocitrate lyase